MFGLFRSTPTSATSRAVAHIDSITEAQNRIKLANDVTQHRQAQIADLSKQADALHADQDLVEKQLAALHERL